MEGMVDCTPGKDCPEDEMKRKATELEQRAREAVSSGGGGGGGGGEDHRKGKHKLRGGDDHGHGYDHGHVKVRERVMNPSQPLSLSFSYFFSIFSPATVSFVSRFLSVWCVGSSHSASLLLFFSRTDGGFAFVFSLPRLRFFESGGMERGFRFWW
jgi:hypothetical protein